MNRVFVLIAASLFISAATVGYAGEPADARAPTALERLAGDDTRELFLRCCWARGRAGFHFCNQYGVCKDDPEASCTGVGAAEGMSASCKAPPPDLPEEGA